MSDIATPESSSTPAPAEGTAAPAAPASNPVSDAARTLAASRASHRAKLESPKATGEPSAAAPASPGAAQAKEPSLEEVQAAIRAQRERRDATKRDEQARQQLAEKEKSVTEAAGELEALRTARQLMAKGDRIGAIKAMYPDVDVTSDLFWDLARQMGTGEDGKATGDGEVDLEKAIADGIAKARAAEKETEEASEREKREKADAALGEARSSYAQEAAEVFKAMHQKFPLINHITIPPERVWQYAEENTKDGRVPDPAETLAKIEADFEERIRAAGYVKAGEQQAPNGPTGATVTNGWRSDPGRPAPAGNDGKTLDQIREERRARLTAGSR